jgi:DNA-binding NarL/FixJ family response regulator
MRILSEERNLLIKVLIADDHAVVREGLKQILSGTPDIVVAAEARNGNEVMDKLAQEDIDFVVLDITMPGRNGLDVLKNIKSQLPKLPVLILSMYPKEQYAVRVLKAGASGYLSKESAPDELINAIRQISRGKKYIGSALEEKLTDLEVSE